MLGRLKEQDALITLIRTLILEPQDDLVTMTVVEAVGMVQTMIEEHVACPTASRLRKYGCCMRALCWLCLAGHLTCRIGAVVCHADTRRVWQPCFYRWT